MFTHTILQRLSIGARQISKSFDVIGQAMSSLAETITDPATDQAVVFALDVSATKTFYMVSDQDLTIETNDGTTPDDTINLMAGVPYVWHTGSYDSFLLTTDVTTLFVTNASGEEATLEIEALTDPTP